MWLFLLPRHLQVLLPSSLCLHQRSWMESHAGPSQRSNDKKSIENKSFLNLRHSFSFWSSFNLFVLFFTPPLQLMVTGTLRTESVATCVWTAPVSRRQTRSNWSLMNSPTQRWQKYKPDVVGRRSQKQNQQCLYNKPNATERLFTGNHFSSSWFFTDCCSLSLQKLFACAKSLFISDQDKRKHFCLLLRLFVGSRQDVGSFQSRMIKVISKPSQKRQSMKNADCEFHKSTFYHLFDFEIELWFKNGVLHLAWLVNQHFKHLFVFYPNFNQMTRTWTNLFWRQTSQMGLD